jgi:hypothetical protein
MKINSFVTYLTVFCFLCNSQITLASTTTLHSDQRIFVKTLEELIAKSDRVQVGQRVRAQVSRDVIVDGKVLIKEGTIVLVKVNSVSQKNFAGIKGKLSLSAIRTESIDGQVIDLDGGYHKEGRSKMALSITLAVIVFLPLIFIRGKSAELPAGTIFDAFTARSYDVVTRDQERKRIDLTDFDSVMSAELLYDNLNESKKPKYFEFEITIPEGVERKFIIDKINDQSVKPMNLDIQSERVEDDELVVNVRIKIKLLVKNFAKGFNTIGITNIGESDNPSTSLVVDIEI